MTRRSGVVPRRPLLALGVAALAAAAAASAAGGATIRVDRSVALVDAPLRVQVLGLAPRARVEVTATTRDASGTPWSSQATFRADGRGRLDLATAVPLHGSYAGAAAMGLFWSLLPHPAAPTVPFAPPPRVERVTLSASSGGGVVARRQVDRLLVADGVVERDERPAVDGFYGDYYAPARRARPRPAVLLLGGSDGGLTTGEEAALLASHGYPALALAYFGEPGLPTSLAGIELDYFATALRWLARQQGVAPARLVVQGASRGSEAALLLGADYPALVDAVVALVPSNVAICSFPGCAGPVWLLHGKPVPYTRQFDDPSPTDDPAAVIPVERVRGPILLACGGADTVWTSCPYAHAIAARARRSELLQFPDAGHEIGYPVPYLPGRYAATEGRTPDANPRAQAQLWPRLLAFLARLDSGP